MTLRIAPTTDIATCQALRRTVFIDEQGVDPELEVDGLDGEATHLLAVKQGRPVGTARILFKGDVAKVGRVCVLPELRGTGMGKALMMAAIAECRGRLGLSQVRLGAQSYAIGFYQALGFVAEGPEFIDAGIPHREMVLEL
ncbi:MAG: GNAT family N-acetyltransferase [Pseudomonadota bacterium]